MLLLLIYLSVFYSIIQNNKLFISKKTVYYLIIMSETGLAEVRKYGVITIPKIIRDALGIKEGDVVRITVEKVEKPKATV